MNHRETREVIVGGVLGSITRPKVIIAALYTTDGELVTIGRTVALKPEQSAQLAAVVEPTVVAEVTADAATLAGQVRHGMHFVR